MVVIAIQTGMSQSRIPWVRKIVIGQHAIEERRTYHTSPCAPAAICVYVHYRLSLLCYKSNAVHRARVLCTLPQDAERVPARRAVWHALVRNACCKLCCPRNHRRMRERKAAFDGREGRVDIRRCHEWRIGF